MSEKPRPCHSSLYRYSANIGGIVTYYYTKVKKKVQYCVFLCLKADAKACFFLPGMPYGPFPMTIFCRPRSGRKPSLR